MGIHERPYYRDETPPGLMPSWNSHSPIAIIIIACVVVFVANMLFRLPGGTLNDLLELHSDDLSRPWMWWRTFTYGFAHNSRGIGHLFWNMLGLWMLGRAVEERYGWAEFWRIYLSSVVLCGAVWMLIHGLVGGPATVLGASGAVLTITMLFVFNFPHATLMIWGVFPMKAWVLGLIVVAGNFLFFSGDRGAPVAHDVHLTGIAYAAAYFYGGLNLNLLDSIPNTIRSWRRRAFGPKLKTYNPDAADGDAAEADRILDKIHRSGQDSLSRKERKFLERYSQNVRKRQGG